MLGSVATALGSVVLGGVIATATVVGVVQSQTAPSGPNPVSVEADPTELIPYGFN